MTTFLLDFSWAGISFVQPIYFYRPIFHSLSYFCSSLHKNNFSWSCFAWVISFSCFSKSVEGVNQARDESVTDPSAANRRQIGGQRRLESPKRRNDVNLFPAPTFLRHHEEIADARKAPIKPIQSNLLILGPILQNILACFTPRGNSGFLIGRLNLCDLSTNRSVNYPESIFIGLGLGLAVCSMPVNDILTELSLQRRNMNSSCLCHAHATFITNRLECTALKLFWASQFKAT